MGTRGAITFVSDGVERTTYNHFDSYPAGLGVAMLDWLRSPEWNPEKTREQVRALRMVDEADKPDLDDEIRHVQTADHGVSTGSDWYAFLRHTQGNPAAILNAGAACDATEFPLDALWCEWAYVVDLDNETFEVYNGYGKGAPEGRWAKREAQGEHGVVSRIRSWPISELRSLELSSDAHMSALERCYDCQ